MKWGIRRYQNKDGSLTAEGRKRYYGDSGNQVARGIVDVQEAIRDQYSSDKAAYKLRDLGEKDAADKLRDEAANDVESKLGSLRDAMLNSTSNDLAESYKTNVEFAAKYADRARQEMDSILSNEKRIQEYADKYFKEVYDAETLKDLKETYGISAKEARDMVIDDIRSGSDHMLEYIVSKNDSIKRWSEGANEYWKNANSDASKIAKGALEYAKKRGGFDKYVLKNDRYDSIKMAIGEHYLAKMTKTEHFYSDSTDLWYNYKPPYKRRNN